MMRNRQWLPNLIVLLLLVVPTLQGCKKKVAAAAPAPPLQPAPPPPVPTITLRATPSTIDQGESTSLQWDAQNATSVRIEPQLGDVQTQGSHSVSPTSSVTYTATAIGPGGKASDSARITVQVSAPPPPPPAPQTEARAITDDVFRQNVQTIYFDYDKSELRSDQVARLEANAAWLKQNPNVTFTIEGHCDERGSQEYNLGLGDQRANRVKEFLISKGIDAARMTTISYGEERPVCHDATEECYRMNRRAAFTMKPIS
jgi:peptidoglycan-associated lipoprotein